MDQTQLEQFKTIITEAIDAHLASGGKLLTNRFTNSPNCKCPIACVIDVNNGKPYPQQLADKLGFSFTDAQMWEFIYGFDCSFNPLNSEIAKIAIELRNKYLPTGA